MNLIRNFLASKPKEELVVIPSGVLFLRRGPDSPKGNSECIFKEAVATIRKTTTEFQYQLVVQRVYEEAEEYLEDNEEEPTLDEDDRVFLLDEALSLCYYSKGDNVVIAWRDLEGDDGDMFEFVCDSSIKAKTFDQFDLAAKRAQYERKYNKVFQGDDSELDEFDFEPPAEESQPEVKSEPQSAPVAPSTPRKSEPVVAQRASDANKTLPETPAKQMSGPSTPKAPSSTAEGTVLGTSEVSLHLYDAVSGLFVEQARNVKVQVIDTGSFNYWLEVTNESRPLIGIDIDSNMNPVFNYEHLSFIFNYFEESGAFSWLLKFGTQDELNKFQIYFMQALWEATNKQKWVKVSDSEREYLIDSFDEMNLDSVGEEADDEQEEEAEEIPEQSLAQQEDDFDIDEEADEVKKFDAKGKNSQLAVGMRNDRNFVIRGDKVGVFKTTDDGLQFDTTIDNVSNLSGKALSPKKVMLRSEDKHMVIQDPNDRSKLYNMDLEYGKVVDEWSIDQNVASFGPTSKFAQMTAEQTLYGVSDNGLFRIDPRLSGNKIVENENKVYTTKNKFSALATTDKGQIAVASSKGDIRLFNRAGIKARVHLPPMGDPIIAIDVSADGNYVLATCKTYLLLIEGMAKKDEKGNVTGLKTFGKNEKPRPKRLQISPEHVAHMQQEMGQPLDFTAAHFNTGVDTKEQTIVTSSGPYVITWSLKKVLRNDRDPYLIKRYSSTVTADNFKFGSDKNVIIALEDDVGMVNRRTFRKPTRESIATPSRRIQALSRKSVVNSPF